MHFLYDKEQIYTMDFFNYLKTQKFYLIKLYITERCNLDCDYCYYKERGFIDANPEDVKQLLQHIPSENINGFVISGGEALLKWENFKQIVSRSRSDCNSAIRAVAASSAP